MNRFHMKCFAFGCLILLASILISTIPYAQINGIITDSKTGKPLVGVEVFMNRTSLATQSDEAGQFKFENALTGFQELVLYKNGYSVYRSSMKIQTGRAYNLKLTLTASKKKKSTRLTEEEKSALKNKLMGSGDGNFVEVLNADELGTTVEGGQRILTAKSPLITQNNATGFLQKYYVEGFPLATLSDAPVKYESLPAYDMKQTIGWEKNRKTCFQGTSRHWLMVMVANRLKEESYSLHDEKGKEVDTKSLISVSSLAGYVTLTISQPLIILYKKEDGTIETSRVITDGPAEVNATGVLLNPRALTMEGAMTIKGLAWQLPLDYQPIAGDVEDAYAQTLERFYEKIYVRTDKPYYYPGEPMWFKGYIHYQEPNWRDSLSSVMYVELINPEKEITLTKTLKIDSGFFHNDFILPDTLMAGTYYLRAYTSLNRNFGDSTLFVKPIPILNVTDKVDHTQGKMEAIENNQLTITSDKKTYKTREKITLTLQTKDKEGKPLAANLSISVTDAVQVVPIAEPFTILNGYPFENEKQTKATELKYPVEYGISFSGKFLNDKGKPEKATLTILQMKPRNMMLAETNEQGAFSMTGFDFYDSATFSFKADKAKDYPYGKVELLPREVPPMDFKENNNNLTVQNTQSPQRIISEYEVPKDVRMLETVEVRARKIEEEYQKDYRIKRPYGKPDYVLKSKDINTSYGNLILSLQGKFPGLIVRQTEKGNWVVYTKRGELSSMSNIKEVMIMLNDVPMGGTPEAILFSINPETVASIEFTNRINVLYGSSSGFGVISIYTKQGGAVEDFSMTPNFQSIKIPGYSSMRKLKFPDYDDKTTDKTMADYRSTIYWNPNIVIDAKSGTATVSFFGADLPGKYRVVTEGVLQNGEAVRCVYITEVVND